MRRGADVRDGWASRGYLHPGCIYSRNACNGGRPPPLPLPERVQRRFTPNFWFDERPRHTITLRATYRRYKTARRAPPQTGKPRSSQAYSATGAGSIGAPASTGTTDGASSGASSTPSPTITPVLGSTFGTLPRRFIYWPMRSFCTTIG